MLLLRKHLENAKKTEKKIKSTLGQNFATLFGSCGRIFAKRIYDDGKA
jgi:hypothetical protein